MMDKPVLKAVLLMLGHGDRHSTPGKRAYFQQGKLLPESLSVEEREDLADEKYYEGEGNRVIGKEFIKQCKQQNIKVILINPGNKDMSRTQRCQIANSWARKFGAQHCLVLSVHSDGFKDEQANGMSIYTSPGHTLSDIYATEGYDQAKCMWPMENFREGRGKGEKVNDPDKEAKFTVLTKTICPAILWEWWFFTNYKNFTNYLNCKKGQRQMAEVMLNTVKEFYHKCN